MPEVKSISVQLRPPDPDRDDPGQITIGYYFIEGDLLTMTDGEGKPMRRTSSGGPITFKLTRDDDERTHAARLTKEIYRMLHGEDKATSAFNRPLIYPH